MQKSGPFSLQKRIVFSASLIFIILLSFSCQSQAPSQAPGAFLPVRKVVDGDTFWLDDGSAKGLKIRLIGIDAPESRNTGRKEIGYYGKEASEWLKRRIEGRKLRIETDLRSHDQYGRLLAYAWLEDGTFLNLDLVRQGYARVYTVPPNVAHAEEFLEAEREARTLKKGLWQDTEKEN